MSRPLTFQKSLQAREIAEITTELERLKEELKDERTKREAVGKREQAWGVEREEMTKTVERLQLEAGQGKWNLEEVQEKVDENEREQHLLEQEQGLLSNACATQNNATALAAELERERTSKSEIQAKLDESEREQHDLAAVVYELKKEAGQLKLEVRENEKALLAAQHNATTLAAELESAQARGAKLDGNEREKHDLAALVDTLKEQVQRLKKEADLFESEARAARNNTTALAAELESECGLQAKLDESERERHDLSAVVAKLKKEAGRLKLEAEEIQKALLAALHNATTLAAELESAQARCVHMKEQLENRSRAEAERDNAEEERQKMQSERAQREVADERARADAAETARAEAETALRAVLEEKRKMTSRAELLKLEAEERERMLDEVEAKLDRSVREQHEDLVSVLETLKKDVREDRGVCFAEGLEGQPRGENEVEQAMMELVKLREEREGERMRMMELEELPRVLEILKAELETERQRREAEKRQRGTEEKQPAEGPLGADPSLLGATGRAEWRGKEVERDENARAAFEKERGEMKEELLRLQKQINTDRTSLVDKEERVQVGLGFRV